MSRSIKGAAVPLFWLAYLLVCLTLPLTYFMQAPSPAGGGLLRLFGWGALAGLAVGGLVLWAVLPLHAPVTVIARLRLALGVLLLGALGGATGAGWLDQSHVVEARQVQLPVVAITELPIGRDRSGIVAETLDPANPTYQDSIAVEDIDGTPEQGSCLNGLVWTGRLGGRWTRHFTAAPCDPLRGRGSTVLVVNDDLEGWRWHAPGPSRRLGASALEDQALAPGLVCRTRPGTWLYRCSSPPQ